jgi:hypothetical protein
MDAPRKTLMPLSNGFMISASLLGGGLGYLLSPHMSDFVTNNYNQAMHAFCGSILGPLSVALYNVWCEIVNKSFKYQYSMLTLMEIVVVVAIVASFGKNVLEAKKRYYRDYPASDKIQSVGCSGSSTGIGVAPNLDSVSRRQREDSGIERAPP